MTPRFLFFHIMFMLQTEFEIKFFVEKREELIETITSLGGVQIHPQILMRRATYDHIGGYDNTKFVRLRDEGTKSTMTYKHIASGKAVDGVSEIEIEISSLEKAMAIFAGIGIEPRNYQETKREKRIIKTKIGEIVECCIDIRPGCPEFIEIEGPTQTITESIAEQLGFDISKGFFGTADFMYEMLGICSRDDINHRKDLRFDNYPVKKDAIS